jgi:hypothetical protein
MIDLAAEKLLTFEEAGERNHEQERQWLCFFVVGSVVVCLE